MDEEWPSYEARRVLLFGAWALAALATVLVEIPALIGFPLFPLGLWEMLTGVLSESSHRPTITHTDSVVFTFVCAAWLVYLALTFGALFSKRRLVFILFYGALCCLLILDVQGCHTILKHMG